MDDALQQTERAVCSAVNEGNGERGGWVADTMGDDGGGVRCKAHCSSGRPMKIFNGIIMSPQLYYSVSEK